MINFETTHTDMTFFKFAFEVWLRIHYRDRAWITLVMTHMRSLWLLRCYSKWKRSRTQVRTNHGQSHPPTPRICPLSIPCPNFLQTYLSGVCPLSGFSVRILSVSILSGVRILSGFWEIKLSGVCLSGLCLSRFCPVSGFCPDFWEKLCPLSVCPAGQGQDRAVRTFAVLVRRRLVLHWNWG